MHLKQSNFIWLYQDFFSSSQLSENGKIVEIIIFNRGRTAESDIKISLDPALKYEIVAATDSSCSVNNSIFFVPRVTTGDDYSVLLLVEGGDFTNERISNFSSSTTKGKIIKDLDGVHGNIGTSILTAVAGIFFAITPIAAYEYYDQWSREERLSSLSFLKEKGGLRLKDIRSQNIGGIIK